MIEPSQGNATQPEAEVEYDLEGELQISDFVWKSLNYFYYWQEEVTSLSDSKLNDEDSYGKFISQNKNPELFFDNLLHPDDRFSFLIDDYLDLENLIDGVYSSNGLEFGLLYACQNCSELIGYVKYILDGSDAAGKNIKRGDLFNAVDGTLLTSSNYNDLLFGSNSTYTLNMVSVQNGTIVNDGRQVTLNKQEGFQTNPIQINKTFTTSKGKVGYLMYNQFVEDKNVELNQIFGEFKNDGIVDLIVDLRYNGGGSVKNCVALASMITGQFSSEIFMKEKWNPKLLEFLTSQFGGESLIERFISTLSEGEPINSLSLERVYILTSSETASASELLITGLSPYIEVIQIGDQTVGKNVGSISVYDYIDDNQTRNPGHKYAMQPIVFKIANKEGFSNYANGLSPDVSIQERIEELGVLGDADELLVSSALSLITQTSKPFLPKESIFPAARVQDPLMLQRRQMFLDKKINLFEFSKNKN